MGASEFEISSTTSLSWCKIVQGQQFTYNCLDKIFSSLYIKCLPGTIVCPLLSLGWSHQ